MEKIRFGIVGIGMMGRMHATSLQRNPHAEVVAVCARTESKVKAFQEEFGVPYGYTNVDELVNNPEVDAIVVATGADAHKAPCLAACKAKKHIFCEKPLATTLEDAKKVVEAEKASGKRLLQIGFMRRFDPDYIKMKKILDSGELGAPLMAHCISRTRSHPKNHTTEQHITNIAIHEIDICRWLLGDEYKNGQVLKVRQSACSTKGYDNPQIVLLETQSGARIDVEVQVADAYGYDIQCQVVCEKGTVNLPDPYAVVKRSNATRSFPILTDWKDRFIEAYDIELTHWVKTLEEKGEPDGPSAWDGYAACVAADTLNRSRGTNQFLPIEMMDKPALYK